MGFASFLISKFEGPKNGRNNAVSNSQTRSKGNNNNYNNNRKEEEESCGVLYGDQVWKPCLKGMHPAWLLAFRVCAFFVLFILLIVNAVVDGASIFYYYTQWTFTLVTIYFGLGSVISMKGCYEYHNSASGERVHNEGMDSERGDYITYVYGATKNTFSSRQLVQQPRPTAGFWGYLLQIIFQMNAGAVMLTDMVFWFIIVPFLTTKNYDLNFFKINMHTVNLVFLLGDTALNCLVFNSRDHAHSMLCHLLPNSQTQAFSLV
ncbi:hypothetical protein KSS87_022716 [Heliosperma pusillum]|nr:hypothetical protein KSS87_022716 [Heliosperma pusillum]